MPMDGARRVLADAKPSTDHGRPLSELRPRGRRRRGNMRGRLGCGPAGSAPRRDDRGRSAVARPRTVPDVLCSGRHWHWLVGTASTQTVTCRELFPLHSPLPVEAGGAGGAWRANGGTRLGRDRERAKIFVYRLLKSAALSRGPGPRRELAIFVVCARGYRTTQEAPRRVEREHGLSVVSNAAHPLKDIAGAGGRGSRGIHR